MKNNKQTRYSILITPLVILEVIYVFMAASWYFELWRVEPVTDVVLFVVVSSVVILLANLIIAAFCASADAESPRTGDIPAALNVLNDKFKNASKHEFLTDAQVVRVLDAMVEFNSGADRPDMAAHVELRRRELRRLVSANLAKADAHQGSISETYRQIAAAYTGGLEELDKLEQLTKK